MRTPPPRPERAPTEWRCARCQTLLGVRRALAMHIKHKRAELIVSGHVTAICPRCGALQETHTGRADAA